MPAHSTQNRQNAGGANSRQIGIDQEMSSSRSGRAGRQRKPSGSRVKTNSPNAGRTSWPALRKQLRPAPIKAPVGSIVRRRAHALRDYERWRVGLGEAAAAQQAAAAYQVSPATIRRCTDSIGRRFGGPRAHTPDPTKRRPGVSGAVQFLVSHCGASSVGTRNAWRTKWRSAGLRSSAIRRWAVSLPAITCRRHYHTLAKRDGIPKRRYAAVGPTSSGISTLRRPKLADGARVVVVVLLDDYSGFCVCCQVVPDMSSEAALQALQAAWQLSDRPKSSSVTMAGPSTPVHARGDDAFRRRLRAAGRASPP